MRRLILTVFVLLPALTALVLADGRSQLYSNPSLPPREVLDRLNLTQAWFANFPMDGQRDGFQSISVADRQLLLQTRSGVVGAIDLENGRILWRALPGRAFKANVGLAWNTFSVFVMSGTDLYSLDRRTGNTQWQFRLPSGLSTSPVADDEQIYLCGSNTRLYAMRVPRFDATGRYVAPEAELRALGRAQASTETRDLVLRDTDTYAGSSIPGYAPNLPQQQGPRPFLMWEVATNQQLDHRPILDKASVLISGNDPNIRAGRLMAFNKFPQSSSPPEVFRYPLDGPLVVSPGQYENMVYVGAADANLNAINLDSGRLEWRYIAGDIVTQAPVATEKDVFVVTQRNGMARVDRATGIGGWRIPAGRQTLEFNNEVDRYLASNPRYVYAQDRAGRFLVIDRLQGKTLSRYDFSNFAFPVVNEQNDRIILAANNGLVLCLHDKEYVQPFRHRLKMTEAEEIAAKLKKPITQPALAKTRFREFLRNFEKANELKIMVSERAFLAENKLENLNREIVLPAINNQPVGEVLTQALAQIGATSIVVRDTILIAPAAGKPMGGMGGNPPPP